MQVGSALEAFERTAYLHDASLVCMHACLSARSQALSCTSKGSKRVMGTPPQTACKQ